MKREDANVGDIVRSKVNQIHGLRYRIVKCLKTVCWVELVVRDPAMKPMIWKNNRYSIFEKITE